MTAEPFTDQEIEAYLDETLGAARARELEQAMAHDATLVARLSQVNRQRDVGVHTLGEIWRQHQIGVPDEAAVGQYLLGVLPAAHADYIEFRLNVLHCPFTQALVEDLRRRRAESPEAAGRRRSKYYHSSAGLLKPKKRPPEA